MEQIDNPKLVETNISNGRRKWQTWTAVHSGFYKQQTRKKGTLLLTPTRQLRVNSLSTNATWSKTWPGQTRNWTRGRDLLAALKPTWLWDALGSGYTTFFISNMNRILIYLYSSIEFGIHIEYFFLYNTSIYTDTTTTLSHCCFYKTHLFQH